MNILDEMALDWFRRLCSTHTAYTKQLELLAIEHSRMSDADKRAIDKVVALTETSHDTLFGLTCTLIHLMCEVVSKQINLMERPFLFVAGDYAVAIRKRSATLLDALPSSLTEGGTC